MPNAKKPVSSPLAIGFALAATMILGSGRALAEPTQEEVFRSINENVRSTVDFDKWIPFILAAIGFVIVVALFNYRRRREALPRALNHPGKLVKEISKQIDLRPPELKQLKLLAHEQQIQNPLVLLLCPSVLAKSIRQSQAQIDRQVITQIVQRLRQGVSK